MQMSALRVPIIIAVIGEGASGGALGIGVGDRILMLENAWYSVIAPESCSSILWRSWEYKEQAAEALKLTAADLIQHGVIDRIVPEPVGGAHRRPEEVFETMRTVILEELDDLSRIPADDLVQRRREKFYAMGVWTE
jgi:acetyl-CoA carboxylase carboxyl transferase subunit alpha